MKKIKIALDNYPFFFSRNIGPNIFLKRLATELKKHNCNIQNKYNPFYDLGLFAIYNKSIFNKPYVIRIGGIYFDKKNTATNTESENKKIFSGIKKSTGVIFISEFTKKLTESFYGKILQPNVVINNSVPTKLFSPYGANKRQELKIEDNEFVIVVSGSWRRHKRLEETIKFFYLLNKEIKNLKLLILGDIRQENKVISKNIIYAGNIHHSQLPDWYRTGNLYLHLAWIDQNANTHVEATACGLPSITTNNGGNREIIENCSSGVVSHADDVYKFNLIDFYNPPEPNYKILQNDFLKIFKNHSFFKNNIKYEKISISYAGNKYYQFFKDLIKTSR